MQVKILCSSSAGNCGLVETEGGQRILIDAGVSFRKLEGLLRAEEVAPGDIDAILLTHEHGDHSAGLTGFAALGTPVYTTRGTAGALGLDCRWQIVPQEARFALGGVMVESFGLPHDAAEPVGWALEEGEERLVWALDVGHLTPATKRRLQEASMLVLESNYCPKLLEADRKRPWALKQRIKGRHGHLSNEEAFEFLTQEPSPRWRKIYLAHLSAQCNDPVALEERYRGHPVPVEVVPPSGLLAAMGA